jgi:aarF domain-containing kinase
MLLRLCKAASPLLLAASVSKRPRTLLFPFQKRIQLLPRFPVIHLGLSLSLDRLSYFFYNTIFRLLIVSKVMLRAAVLAIIGAPLLVTFPIWWILNRNNYIDGNYIGSTWWLDYLLWSMELAGPTWIKIGQWASSRSDLFPSWVCQKLTKLQNCVSPHPFAYTRSIIERELGQSLESVFERFDRTPVGVGAVAQVYRARLQSSKEDVAVKVLHPNAQLLVELDLKVMYVLARICEFVVPESHWLSLPEEVEIFAVMMNQQLDMRSEKKNLEKFRRNFIDWPNVDFPSPDANQRFNSKYFLVESWVDGISINRFLKWNSSCFDRQIATIGLTSFLKMLILDNHLHTDLHPGNILVTFQHRESGELLQPEQLDSLKMINTQNDWVAALKNLQDRDYGPFVLYLDAGLTSSLSTVHLTNFIDLFKAITEFNGGLISSLMVQRSKNPSSVIDFDNFSASMQSFMDRIRRNSLRLNQINVSDILQYVFTTVRKHHVKIDSEFANIGVAIMLLEGIGHQLEPDMDLLHGAIPFLNLAIRLRMKGGEKGFWEYWFGK